MFFHVAIHEAGHVVVLKSVLGLEPPRRPLDLDEPEPRAWMDFTRGLLGEPAAGRDPTQVAAFLFGGVEALIRATATGAFHASRFHGFNGPDGRECDAELIDLAMMSYGADRWRGADIARRVVEREWSGVLAVANLVAAAGEIDPDALRPVLNHVGAA